MEDLRGINLCGHVLMISTKMLLTTIVIEIVLFSGGYGWNYPLTRIRITTHSVLVPWSAMTSMSSP